MSSLFDNVMSFVMGVCNPIKSVFVGCYLGKSMGDEGKDCGMAELGR